MLARLLSSACVIALLPQVALAGAVCVDRTLLDDPTETDGRGVLRRQLEGGAHPKSDPPIEEIRPGVFVVRDFVRTPDGLQGGQNFCDDNGNPKPGSLPLLSVTDLEVQDPSFQIGHVCDPGQSTDGSIGFPTIDQPIGTIGGTTSSQLSGGASGPPLLTTIEISNNQAEEFIRRRREAMLQPLQPIATPVDDQPGSAPQQTAAQQKKVSSKKKKKAGQASRPGEPKPIILDPGYDVATYGPERSPMYGAWAQLYVDYERHKNLAPGSVDNPTRTQTTFGQIGGFDFRLPKSAFFGSNAKLGFLAGNNRTRSTFSDTPNVSSALHRVGGGFVGGYFTLQRGGFALDTMVKADFFERRQRAVIRRTRTTTTTAIETTEEVTCDDGQVLLIDPTDDLRTTSTRTRTTPAETDVETVRELTTGKVSEHNYTIGSNVSYRFDLRGGRWIEPVAGIRFTYTDFGSGAFALNLRDGEVLRVQGGLRIGSSRRVPGYILSTSLLGMIYSDVHIEGFTLTETGLTSTVTSVDEGKLRGLGRLVGKLDNGRGLSYTAQVEVRGGKDVIGVGGRLGFRYVWQ